MGHRWKLRSDNKITPWLRVWKALGRSMRPDKARHLFQNLRRCDQIVSQLRMPMDRGVWSEVVGELAGHSRVGHRVGRAEYEQQRALDALVIGEHGSLCPLQLGACAGRHEFGAASRRQRRPEV